MVYPILEVPDSFILFNKSEFFVEISQWDTYITFIENNESKQYIGIRIYGRVPNSLNSIVMNIFQEKNGSGQHIHQVFEYSTKVELSEYQLTMPSLLKINLANFESMFCSGYLFK